MTAVLQSAVRLPSPDLDDLEGPSPSPPKAPSGVKRPHAALHDDDDDEPEENGSRKERVRHFDHDDDGPRNGALPRDVDRARALERARQQEERARKDAAPLTAEEKQAAAKAEYERLLTMRSGGTYVPPARLRALQAEIGTDPQSKEFQRMAWEALKKSINGMINKINVSNIKHIVPELFGENLVRGRGLFCRSIMKAQAASLPFTPIYAAMAAIVNTKLPQVGELLVNRLIVQFRKAFKRNDKSVCLSSTTFLAHLINQQVTHETLAAQILVLLLNKPTDDSVEIAVGLMKEVGQHIEEFNSQIALVVFDQFRSILHEADIDKRVQYMIEVLFQIRKDKYKDNSAVKEELDLVEEEDQITHNPLIDAQIDVQDGLNVFKFDPEWEANEEAYKKLKAEILGEADGSDEEDDDDSDASSSDDEVEQKERNVEIKDQTNTDLVNLRRTIYLTIMSSGGFEECTHKLLRINLPQGLENEMPSMLIECSSQERTYNKFFGLIAERLCKLNRMWIDLFEQQFIKYYDTIHRYETNRLRIIAQLFGHLLASDAIGWHVFNVIHLNEDETTSSSRIFIKILFEDLSQGLGMKKLADKLKDDMLQPSLAGIFPVDNPRNTRFSINFFTAIGMGALTEGMREWLKNMPKPAVPALPAKAASSSERSRSRSVSSYSSYSSRSRTPSRTRERGRSYTRSVSPPRRSARARSYSDSRSRSPTPRRRAKSSSDRGRSYTRSLTPARRSAPARRRSSYASSRSRSRTPPPGRRVAQDSISRSPPPRRRRSPSASASPPARKRRYTSSLSRSSSRSHSPPPNKRSVKRRAGSYSRSRSRSVSPPPPRKGDRSPPPRRTRGNTSSVSRSRSRSRSPVRRRGPAPGAGAAAKTAAGARPKAGAPQPPVQRKPENDMDGIHPSRRNLLGERGRPMAGDFM